MNSYNENLHANVVASLQSQQQDLKKTASAANASMFALYHAEGATITADDKLEAAQEQLDHDAQVKLEAVRNSNISNNLLASAGQANDYLKQSVTNTAVSAANIQVATNSIVKLASDVGSIYSIIQAADFDTHIYRLAKEVGDCINETAYDAEFASQLALEASVLTASVSGSTVLDKAKSNNGAVNNLLKVASAGFDVSSQLVAAQNANLAAVSAKEKIAEGVYEDLSIDLEAATEAYESTNTGLNMDLQAYPQANKPQSVFGVEFNLLASPFPQDGAASHYPVKDYYLFIVKNKQQSTFSITDAETILRGPDQDSDVPSTKKKRYIALTSLLSDHIEKDSNRFVGSFDYPRISIPGEAEYMLQDTDGDDILTGTDYVVFVLAIFLEDYKAGLNTYDDFISAPSATFRLANRLAIAQFNRPAKAAANSSSGSANEATQEKNGVDSPEYILFTTAENPEFNVEYRCIFLPVGDALTKDNLNNSAFSKLADQIAQIEKITDEYDRKIEELEATVVETSEQIQESTKGAPQVGAIPKKLLDLIAEHNANKKALKDALKAKVEAIDAINQERADPINFIFNVDIAEQVSAGNYIKVTDGKPVLGEKTQRRASSLVSAKRIGWRAHIDEDATDNFGNSLIDGHYYIPVILSASAAAEENLSKFVNTCTDYNNTRVFQFKQPK